MSVYISQIVVLVDEVHFTCFQFAYNIQAALATFGGLLVINQLGVNVIHNKCFVILVMCELWLLCYYSVVISVMNQVDYYGYTSEGSQFLSTCNNHSLLPKYSNFKVQLKH